MDAQKLPIVSIIIPCRNEEKFISGCLDSIIANDYPKDDLEILVVDGMSKDKTKEIVKNYIRKYSFISSVEHEKQGSAKQVLIKLFENPKKIAPAAQNIGVKNAKGEIIMIMDAHVIYKKDYISKCVEYLKSYNADNVGGILITTPTENSIIAKAIVISLSNPFGAGNSYFRIGSKKIRWADTVPYGCYKREVFEKIGLYNEKMARSYDMDFNIRLKRAGGKILLVPSIIGYYYPKSNLKDFLKHNFLDGIWVTYPLKFGLKLFYWRHLIPLIFVAGLISSLFFSLFLWQVRFIFFLIFISYILVNLFFSAVISTKKGFKYLFIMPVVFAVRHLGYGLGSLWGFIKLVL